MTPRLYTHWGSIEKQRARIAAHRLTRLKAGALALHQLAIVAQHRTAQPLDAHARRGEIYEEATRRADEMGRRIDALDKATTVRALLAWLNEEVQSMQGGAFAFEGDRPEGAQLAGMFKRARAPEWWRRQLSREVIRRAEHEHIEAGRVNVEAGAWYCSDETVRRRIEQNRANRDILERTELENEAGEVWTLKALADTSTGNKAVRRGELMTRIRGCEEWADAQGHEGVFLTLTAPSRFHSHLMAGGRNPKYEGATPRDAQAWLCSSWAKARARLARLGVSMYGFRVAEPHHDGCPHWHALLWAPVEQMAKLTKNLREWWLKDSPDEAGAQKYRFKAVKMALGGAAGYAAKYIAKNIDDAGAVAIEGHHDEHDGKGATFTQPSQGELFSNPALRVEAWAAAWGIRQFQAIGQPPVTVWRELRRVKADAAELAPIRVQVAWDHAHRHDDERACWHTYINTQGGTNIGRDYKVRLAVTVTEHEGRYETVEKALPVGVFEAGMPEAVVPSTRRKWKPREGFKGERVTPEQSAKRATGRSAERAATVRRVPPWTRFNNCTQLEEATREHLRQVPFSEVMRELLERQKRIEDWGRGGGETERPSPCVPQTPSSSSTRSTSTPAAPVA